MSKIEVIGPRELLMHALGTIQQSAAMQVDPEIQLRMPAGAEAQLKRLEIDPSTIAERLFYEDLKRKIERLLALLPPAPGEITRLDAARAITSLAHVIDTRITHVDERARRRAALATEIEQLTRDRGFLIAVERLAPPDSQAAGVDVIAVAVKDRASVDRLAAAAGRLHATLETARTDDGSYIGLLTTEKERADQLREALRDDRIPEAPVPDFLAGLPLAARITAIDARLEALGAEAARIDAEVDAFARTWRGLYEAAHEWLEDQLALLTTSAHAYETSSCFVLFGWTPSASLGALEVELATRYGGRVIVEQKQILNQDLDAVPVALRNPGYFQPFQLLVSWLPLPKYTSFDPTPFVAIFFPLIFGMILGDVGYGVVLLVSALVLIARAGNRATVEHAGKILGVAAVYATIFGVFFGECFGEAGAHAVGLPTPWIDRRTSIIPMLYFAAAVGGVHVIVGRVLGLLTALHGKQTKEAAFRLASVAALVCVAAIAASYFAPVGALVRRPLLVVLAILLPVLVLTGGLLAPFELLRDLGNIISYARIMAVGLASVLLAYVANRLAGAVGTVWVGAAVAILLHAINIVLGVFAPTVHGLRLHYVEFFSKFVEPGGRRFAPLKLGE